MRVGAHIGAEQTFAGRIVKVYVVGVREVKFDDAQAVAFAGFLHHAVGKGGFFDGFPVDGCWVNLYVFFVNFIVVAGKIARISLSGRQDFFARNGVRYAPIGKCDDFGELGGEFWGLIFIATDHHVVPTF